MKKFKTSEWVSLGHSDKVADYISEYILDKIIEKDPKVRYAVECQIKDNNVTLAGELTTTEKLPLKEVENWVKKAVNDIGYTKQYQERFGKENTICGDDIVVHHFISAQSPDIAQGVNKDAWGDQGIFFGHFCNETQEGQGIEYQKAKEVGQSLYQYAKDMKYPIGLDIKTQATVSFDEYGEYTVEQFIAAVPVIEGEMTQKELEMLVNSVLIDSWPQAKGCKLIVNGTGAYTIHGPVGDSGTTGRKLVVDFYGSRSRIGGGSPWTKDGSKADLTLNMYAYDLARDIFNMHKENGMDVARVETEVACCIGKRDIICYATAYDSQDIPFWSDYDKIKIKPSKLIKKYKLDKPIFCKLCKDGLFTTI